MIGECMDFKQLQSYVTVVKYKSFTIAAEMLGTSQPTISTHIRILEEELNSRLLIRTARSFEITSRGWELYECAQNILKLREDMINRWNEKESKVIQLGVSTIPSAYILPEVLPEFGKLHSDVYFVVNQSDSQGIIDAVHKGTYDVGLVGMKTEDELLEFQSFYQDRMVLITPINEHYLSFKNQKYFPASFSQKSKHFFISASVNDFGLICILKKKLFLLVTLFAKPFKLNPPVLLNFCIDINCLFSFAVNTLSPLCSLAT